MQMNHGSAQMSLVVIVLLGLIGAPAAKGEGSEEKDDALLFDRMVPEPVWHADVTGNFVRIIEQVSGVDEARVAEALPYAEATGRAFDTQRVVPRGNEAWWRATIEIPADASSREALVLEVDESRLIEQAWINGEAGSSFSLFGLGQRFESGEGFIALPPVGPGDRLEVVFQVRDLTHLYRNGFGRVLLRPASIDERVRLVRSGGRMANREPAKQDLPQGSTAHLINTTRLSQSGVVRVRQLDFFGATLSERTDPFRLSPGARQAVQWTDTTDGKQAWKIELRVEQNNESGFRYWHYPNAEQYQVVRGPETWTQLPASGWTRVPAPSAEPFAYPLPETGATEVSLPHHARPVDAPTHKMWFARSFDVPAHFEGQRVHLFLHSVKFAADVFIDGKRVGSVKQWELPGTVDLTDYITPGATHELALGVTNYVAALRPGAPVPKDGSYKAPSESLAGPVGHMLGRYPDGTPGVLSVPELWALPAARVEHAAIRTAVTPTRRITVLSEVLNQTAQRLDATLLAEVYDRGQRVATLPAKSVRVMPGKAVDTELGMDWSGARLWRPEDPHLYELRLTLTGRNGEVLDVRRERFGFREFGIDGRFFTLNGVRFKPYGSGHQPARLNTWPFIPDVQRVYRHHFKSAPYFTGGIDANWLADEMGVLIKDENLSHNGHHSRRYDYQRPLIFDRLAQEFETVYRFRPNNASTWMWDVGNELNFAGDGEEARVGELYARIKAMDPTRFVTNSGGQGTPIGPAVEVYDTHSNTDPYSRRTWWNTRPEERPDYFREKFSHAAYLPLGEDERDWTIGASHYAGDLIHVDGKPHLYSESLNPHSFVKFPHVGQQAFMPMPAQAGTWDFRFSIARLDWTIGRKFMIELNRQAELSGWLSHINRAYTRAQSVLAAFPLERSLRFTQQQPVVLQFTVHNDRTKPETLEVSWSLLDGTETLVQSTRLVELAPAGMEIVNVDLAGAGVVPVGDYDLVWTVRPAGQAPGAGGWFRDSARLSVMAESAIDASGLVVFDPQGVLEPFVQKAKGLTDLSAWDGQSPLVIAPDALDDVTIQTLAAVGQRVEAGGRLLLLDQENPPKFFASQPAFQASRINGVAAIDPHSPITAGITQDDLRFWRTSDDDQIVHRGLYDLPRRGWFRPHLVGGKGMLITRTPLLEVAEGQGRVMLSQLNLGRALGHEPMASLVLDHLFDWARSSPDGSHRAGVLAIDDQTFVDQLRDRLHADVSPLAATEPLNSYRTLIANVADRGSVARLTADASALRDHLADGGQLILFNLDMETASELSSALSLDFGTEPFATGQTHLTRFDPLVAGLTHADVFWEAGNARSEVTRRPFKSFEPARDHTGYVRLTGAELTPLTSPAYLATAPVGRGRVIFYNIRSLDYPTPAASRVLATVLRNAGVGFLEPSRSADEDADRWVYTSIDLRPFVNRQFDDQYDAAVRGWHAEGPRWDMGGIPLGQQVFEGVQFDIIDPATNRDRSIIAMSGTREVGVLPAEVKGIPVNRKADRLVFLYSAAWGSPGFTFKVWTEDRARWIPTEPDPFHLVKMRPDVDSRDFTEAGRVRDGFLAMPGAEVAWTKMVGNRGVGLYMKVWENPTPEKIIESIDILSPGTEGEGQVFVVAISAANEKSVEPVALEKVLPDDVKPAEIIDHYQNRRYGIALKSNGQAPAIHDAAGTRVFELRGWMAQGNRLLDSGKHEFRHFGRQAQAKAVSMKPGIDALGHPTRTFQGRTNLFAWTQTLTYRSDAIGLRYEIEALRDFPETWKPNVTAELFFRGGAFDGPTATKPNANPVRFVTDADTAEVRLDMAWRRWFRGYWVRGSGVRSSAFQDNPRAGERGVIEMTIQIP